MQVWLDVFGVHGANRARAVTFMALHRRQVRRLPGIRFAKLMGTGSGDTFTMGDADLGHWAILTVVDGDTEPVAAAVREAFLSSRAAEQWRTISHESAHIRMRPLHSHGSWSGQRPFDTEPVRPDHDQPVASITRARLKPRMIPVFWRAVPPVVADLRDDPAVRFTLGIGEAPLGLQGTFSIWSSGRSMSDFAYRRPAHRAAIERTHELQWYSEELFARFAVESIEGTYRGRSLLG